MARHFAGQGFRRHQLEVPISTSRGDLRADALIYRRQPELILLCEGKSGRNIEEEQARRYIAAGISWLRRAGAIPPELMRVLRAVAVHPLFVGREEHRADLERGLRHLDIEAPLLTIGVERVRLSGTSGIRGLDDFDQLHDGGLPPARIPVDHQSPDEDLLELLIPEVIGAQARAEEIVAVEAIAEGILPEWPVLSRGARHSFVGRLEPLLIALAGASSAGSSDTSVPRGRATVGVSSSTRPLRPVILAGERRPGKPSSGGLKERCGGSGRRRSRGRCRSTIWPIMEAWPTNERT